jgi:hypothetical protein
MVDKSLEAGIPFGDMAWARFAASLQRDFDLSKIAELLYGRLVDAAVSYDVVSQ